MSDPRITFVSQSAQGVSVSYADLPPDTAVVFVDEFGGQRDGEAALTGGGSAEVPTTGLKGGQYYLSARASGQEVARTVKFYIAG